jgi:hypothetical protein
VRQRQEIQVVLPRQAVRLIEIARVNNFADNCLPR